MRGDERPTLRARFEQFASHPFVAPAFVVVFFAALACVPFWRVLTQHGYFLWDVPDQYWADLQYLCGAVHDGAFPLWNPYDRFGYPFPADPQAGAYDPLNWTICGLAGRAPSLAWAEARVPFFFALAGCGMTAFLRALELPWSAALTGGIAFMFAPFQRRMWEVNLTYTLALLPWWLWAVERLAQRPCNDRAAVLSLLVAAAVSVGSPPSLYFTVLTAGTYAAVRCLPLRETWKPAALSVLLALGTTAVMVVPTVAMSRMSVQHGRSYASISEGGYRWREWIGLVWPRNKYLYVGAPVAILSVLGAFASRGRLRRTQRIVFGTLALVAFAMTFGDHSPVYRLAYAIVPGVSAFRGPVRYSAILGAATAVLAANGVAALPRPRVLGWLAGLALVAFMCTVLPPQGEVRDGQAPGQTAQWMQVRARIGDVSHSWRMLDEFGVGLRAGTRFRARDARGYQDPLSAERYARVMNALGTYPQLLEQFNVRWLLRGPHFIHGDGHHFLPVGLEPTVAVDRGADVWETRAPLPGAFWTPAAQVLHDEDEVFARLAALAPTWECLLEASDGVAEPIVASTVTDVPRAADAIRVDRDSVDVTYTAPRSGWLVVNEAFDPGWHAWVDGRETPVRRADLLVRALRVPGGQHHVHMAYEPRGFRGLAALAVLSLLVSLALAAGAARTRVTP